MNVTVMLFVTFKHLHVKMDACKSLQKQTELQKPNSLNLLVIYKSFIIFINQNHSTTSTFHVH